VSNIVQYYFTLCFYTCSIVISLSMNKLAMTLATSIYVASVFLILISQTPNLAKAYSCSSSSSTHNINSQSGVSGSSGSCSSSSSASTSSAQHSTATGSSTGPNVDGVATHIGAESTVSNSAGGAQSSCSFSFGFSNAAGSNTFARAISQPGHCP
jgi:hypothetical protein